MVHWKFLVLFALQCVLVSCYAQLTTSGENCTFPFTYRGVTYNSCTTKNHDRPWCSTSRYYNGNWGNCEGYTGSGEKTTGGETCAFPFTYKGVKYNSCTTAGRHHRAWCSIAVNYDVDNGKWGDCAAFESSGQKTEAGEFCVIPFRYNGKSQDSCITEGTSRQWCSTTANYDKDKRAGTCKDGHQLTTSGKNCTLPFTYMGVTYNSCTTKKHDRPWCSTTRYYNGNWENCAGFKKSDEETTEGDHCAFPFTYKGVEYNSCTTIGHDRPWCSIAVNYAVDGGKWGNCEAYESSGVKTGEGQYCVFPFTYKSEKYDSCITKGDEEPWCSTTSNYDKDKKSGSCKGFFIDSSNTTSGAYCAFPFIYRGHHYNTCITKNHDNLWCSTTTNYDEDKKWENCA